MPAKETNYFCMLFDLPADQDYHIIGDQPFLDNLEVMHHILVYGCDIISKSVTKNQPFSLFLSVNFNIIINEIPHFVAKYNSRVILP